MRTTLDIDEKLVEDVIRFTGEKRKSKAVSKALEEYLRRRAIDELRAMAGKIQIDDTRDTQKAADRRRQERLDELRRG